MPRIHATAQVDAGAKLADDVEVGAFSVVGPHVVLGAGTVIGPHAVITGHTRIGRNNNIFQFVSLGAAPQDQKYSGEPTRLAIGGGYPIREFCLHSTAAPCRTLASLASAMKNWIMAYAHLAHDSPDQGTTPFLPITRSLPVTCTLLTTPFSVALLRYIVLPH